MGLIIGGVPPHDLILDGHSVSLYVGGNPPTKVWPTIIKEVVQITLGTGFQARDAFRSALTSRGLDYTTITEVPFEIELVGTGSAQNMFFGCSSLTTISPLNTSQVTNMTAMFNGCAALTRVPHMDTSQVTNMFNMFYNCSSLTSVPAMDTSSVTSMEYMFNGCSSLTSVPAMDTSNVTNMSGMFRSCSSLTHVPDMDTRNVTTMSHMFYGCSALTDGNVRLIGRHPSVNTDFMITNSGLTREPFFNPDGTPDDGIIIDVVQITLGTGFATRDAFRAALTARGLDYATITEVPFEIELVGSGEAVQLFRGCSALTSVPPLDTSQVTNMNGMFQECGSLVTVPPLDTRNVVRAPSMFAYCRSLTSVPDLDAAKMVDVSVMFVGCVALTDGNVRLMNKNPNVTTTGMISGSGLTREPWDTVAPPVARTVTINGSVTGWNQSTATGDTSLIQEWIGSNQVRFHAPTRCDQRVYNVTAGLTLINAGDTIPTGAPIQPVTHNGPYTFTEVI